MGGLGNFGELEDFGDFEDVENFEDFGDCGDFEDFGNSMTMILGISGTAKFSWISKN